MAKYQPFNDLPAAPGHFVYVALGEEDQAIYVGMTRNATRRVKAHRSTSWWPLVRRMAWLPCSTEAEARLLERETIHTLAPLANFEGQNWTVYADRIAGLLRRGGLTEPEIDVLLGRAA